MTFSWPYFDQEQIKKVSEVISSGKVNYWTGEEGGNFEKEFASWCGTKYAVAVSNGSVALSLALHALGIKRGDEVIVPPRTFVATASAPALIGAIPVFVDIDRNSQAITAETIESFITPRTKAICVVHLGGFPADMREIINLAKSKNIAVIEDCAQAHGAKIDNQSVGSFGDLACWSFCQDKIISTLGEGGMITTSREDLWEKIWSLKDHGKDRNLSLSKVNPKRKEFRWLHKNFGTNLRLTEVQSAVGRIQLKRLEDWNKKRNLNATILKKHLDLIPFIRVPKLEENLQHAWYKFYAFINFEKILDGWSRARILEELHDEGINAFSGSCGEVYLEESFQKNGYVPKKRLKIAEELGRTSIIFEVHPTISCEEMSKRALKITKVLKRALR